MQLMASVKLDNEGVGSVNLGMFKGGSLIIKNEGVGSTVSFWQKRRIITSGDASFFFDVSFY